MTRRVLCLAASASALLASCRAPAPPGNAALVAAPAPTRAVVGAAPPGSGPRVTIRDFAFAPATLTVPVGGSVSWLNEDAEPHTVVADDGAIRSSALDTGDGYTYRFAAAGTFRYHCSIHPQMTGAVVVQ